MSCVAVLRVLFQCTNMRASVRHHSGQRRVYSEGGTYGARSRRPLLNSGRPYEFCNVHGLYIGDLVQVGGLKADLRLGKKHHGKRRRRSVPEREAASAQHCGHGTKHLPTPGQACARPVVIRVSERRSANAAARSHRCQT